MWDSVQYFMLEYVAIHCIDDLTLMSSTWDRQIMNWVVNCVHWAIMVLDWRNAGDICIRIGTRLIRNGRSFCRDNSPGLLPDRIHIGCRSFLL